MAKSTESAAPLRAPQLREMVAMLRGARSVVAFTGAGISTESGIPDFRSPGGIWTKMAPIDFRDFMASAETRKEAWRRKFALSREFSRAKPNEGHRALATLQQQGRLAAVITQNIDNLHQDSGVPESHIVELHGNGSYALCLACKSRYTMAEVKGWFEASGEAPTCLDCGGIVKSGTISFGQPMPEDAMRRAEAATLDCDLFLAIGSSLQVFPAAGFPIMAKKNGARLVILNREPTEMDQLADLTLHQEIGPTLHAVCAQVGPSPAS